MFLHLILQLFAAIGLNNEDDKHFLLVELVPYYDSEKNIIENMIKDFKQVYFLTCRKRVLCLNEPPRLVLSRADSEDLSVNCFYSQLSCKIDETGKILLNFRSRSDKLNYFLCATSKTDRKKYYDFIIQNIELKNNTLFVIKIIHIATLEIK